MTTTRAAVPIRFYDCPVPSFEDTISKCDKPLYDWLVSIDPPLPDWTPQHLEEIRIFAAVQQARVDAQAACEASKFAPQPVPQTGVSVSVSTKLAAGPAGDGETQEGLRASVNVGFSPPVGCGSIPYQIIHSVKAIGGSYHPENTVFETSAVPPAKNGTGNFANTIVFDLVNADTAWRNHIHKVFTGGTWRIKSARVFAHYSEWELAGDPEPGAELAARSEAFDANRLRFELPDFPDLYGASGPRWLVVHRYSHQQSGRWFYLADWKTALNSQNVTWPEAVFGRGHASEVTHDDFVAPDDGDPAFFDPDGTWLHQSGVIDFAMTLIQVQTMYASQLCAETFRSINPLGAIDPRTASFLSPQAYYEETVEVRTIKQYKACYRITAIEAIDGLGLHITARLINPFGFAACIVARMPLGSGAQYGAIALSNYTIVLVRNLPANSESGDVDFVLPIANMAAHPATIDYKMSDVVYDGQNGGGIVEHGFACASGAYADGEYITTITWDASALPAAAGHIAEAWAFINDDGNRFWSHLAEHSGAATDVVFSFTLTDTLPSLGAAANGQAFLATLRITGEWWNGSSWSLPQQQDRLIGFNGAEARARYGTFLDIYLPAGRREYGALFFDSWPGGNDAECAQALLDKMVAEGMVRNVTAWSVLVKPRLMITGWLLARDDYPVDPPVLGGSSIQAAVCLDYLNSTTVKVCLI